MEDAHNHLKELIKKFDNSSIKEALQKVSEQSKTLLANHNSSKESIADNINLLARKNKQIEAEVQRLQMSQSKNNEFYNKKNNERFKMAKKVIEYEEKNEDLENQISKLESLINSKEEEIRKISCPTSDELYHEIIKGFGVEFVKKQGKTYAKIKNKEKNDIFYIEANECNANDTCNKIWDTLY